MKKFFIFLLLLFYGFYFLGAQNKFLIQNKRKTDKINFKLINNLVVIPVEVNGVELSFILDTGVSKPIIFNFLNISDSLKIKNTEKIFIRGLGEGEPIEALKSSNNIFKIGDAIKLNQNLYAIPELGLNFAPRLGVLVNGIIGLDLFRDFVVEIHYSSKFIKLTEPTYYNYKKCKSCERFRLEFYNDKPYINAQVSLKNKKIPVKLLIDSGGSDSLWLFEDDSLGIISGDNFFRDFLGHGLSGSVYGKRGKTESFSLKSFTLKKTNVAYPDANSVFFAKKVKDRNGTVAGNILKRFNLTIDYKNFLITLKKNKYFKEKFNYNKSGIELAHDGVRFVKEYEHFMYRLNENEGNNINSKGGIKLVFDKKYKMSLKPAYAIVELRNDSPAEKAGLKKGDIILTINAKPTHHLKLEQIMSIFYGNAGKQIKLKIERNEQVFNYSFKLENLLE